MDSRAIATGDFRKTKALVTSKYDLKFRKKSVKYYIWSTTLCGAETWTLRKLD